MIRAPVDAHPAVRAQPVAGVAPLRAPRVARTTRMAHVARVARDHLALTKPKVALLLVVVGVVAARVADPSIATLDLVTFALLGYLAAGGAAAVNHVADRHLDARMARTRDRPVASGRVGVRSALAFAAASLTLGIGGALLLLGPAVAAWTALGALTYAGLYTFVLKRRTHHNIVIGGLAGSCGALAGWALAEPGLAAGAWCIAALVFLWTPPHFWGLAIARDADYRAAGVPMLPQVRGLRATCRAIALYALASLAASLVLAAVTSLGARYLVAAAVLGVGFTLLTLQLWRAPSARLAGWTFKLSGAYLGLLLAAMLVDLAA